jgi:translation elongation factor EF-Ts
MKTITAEDVRKLREETGEGMMVCKKILEDRYAAEEKQEIINILYKMDLSEEMLKVLGYLVRKA